MLTSDQRKETSINSQMPHSPSLLMIQRLKHNRASSTAALTAAQLRTLETVLGSDEIQQCPLGIRICKINLGSVQEETEC